MGGASALQHAPGPVRAHLRQPEQHVRHVPADAGGVHVHAHTHTLQVEALLTFLLCVQLSVKVQNVPALSGGVSCVFEDLTETPGEVLSRGQVKCTSPSLRDLPSDAHTHGERPRPHPSGWLVGADADCHLSFLRGEEGGAAEPALQRDRTSVHLHHHRLLQLLRAQLVSPPPPRHPHPRRVRAPANHISPSPSGVRPASAVRFPATGANIATSAPTTCRTAPSRRGGSATWRFVEV